MKKYLLVVLVLMAIADMGCKDNAYAPGAPAPANSYFPATLGSTWRYRDSIYGEKTDIAPIYGVFNDTISFTITGGTSDLNGLKCYDANVFSRHYGAGTAYFYNNSHIFGLVTQSAPYGLTFLQLLTDTAKVGYNWTTSPVCGSYTQSVFQSTQVRTVNTILERNITKVVGGKTFTNVIHTSVNFQAKNDLTGFHNIAYYDFYMAQGVGLIEKDAYIYGNLNETETIVDYNIKN
ncbi:MAG: hypothetical protein ACHQIM_07615 [Sphingobacteriales bacterium]